MDPVLALEWAVCLLPAGAGTQNSADDLEWRRISGNGTLVSFTVARRPVAAHFAAETPQILAVVAWDEGPRFATEIVDTNPEELRVGIAVRPVFTEHPDGGVTLLRYTAAR